MSEYIVELDSKHSIALKLAFAEEMRGGDFVRGEIVRCRDCEHNYDNLCHEHECNYCGEPMRIEPDGFCKWGVRRVSE